MGSFFCTSIFFFFIPSHSKKSLKTKETAEAYLESTVDNAVVIVPASSSQKAGHEGCKNDLRIEFSPVN